MHIFKEKSQKGFKSRFDTAIAKYSSRAAGIFRNFGKRFDLRRVMVILLQQKNFSTNVIYFVVGHESFIEEAIEVEDRRGLWLGGSWRYIAGGLCRGREAEEVRRRRRRSEDGRRVEI